MYEKPYPTMHEDSLDIFIIERHAARLLEDLRNAGFGAELLEEPVFFEDDNSNSGREEVFTIKLSASVNKQDVRMFLRKWNP